MTDKAVFELTHADVDAYDHMRAMDALAQPVAWIIERPGFAPIMCHYEVCAKQAEERGAIVTPYRSRVQR